MPKEFSRAARIGDQIQRELAEIIRLELKDPRVTLVTITGVQVGSDLGLAQVYVSCLGSAEQREACMGGLNRGSGFLRRELGRRMKTRTVPQLRFVYDSSVERGSRLSRLIREAVESDAAHPHNEGES
jgi:ribosome-binding factor A